MDSSRINPNMAAVIVPIHNSYLDESFICLQQNMANLKSIPISTQNRVFEGLHSET